MGELSPSTCIDMTDVLSLNSIIMFCNCVYFCCFFFYEMCNLWSLGFLKFRKGSIFVLVATFVLLSYFNAPVTCFLIYHFNICFLLLLLLSLNSPHHCPYHHQWDYLPLSLFSSHFFSCKLLLCKSSHPFFCVCHTHSPPVPLLKWPSHLDETHPPADSSRRAHGFRSPFPHPGSLCCKLFIWRTAWLEIKSSVHIFFN